MKDWKDLRAKVENTKPNPELQLFRKELESFDWLYAMSDSREVVQAGAARRAELWAKARRFGVEGETLFNECQAQAMR